MLRRLRAESEPNALDAVFVTRNGTWHQVVNIERRWRAIRKDTGFDWVTPHTFRKTVATLISEQVGSEEASRQLGHSSSQITREHYIARHRWPLTTQNSCRPSPTDRRRTRVPPVRRSRVPNQTKPRVFTTSKRPTSQEQAETPTGSDSRLRRSEPVFWSG